MKAKTRAIVVLVGTGAAFLATAALAGAAPRQHEPDLHAVAAATARYQVVARAEHDGYVQSSPCEQSPAGGMGFHYVNQALASDLEVDPLRPEVLLYAPGKHGTLRLVAVEYFVAALANTPTGPAPWFGPTPPPAGFFNPAPTLFGRTFDGPMAGHAPGMPWHYDLHVWIWEQNPAGIFAPWNPRVHC